MLRQHAVLISLGAIVTPKIPLAIAAYSEMIAEKSGMASDIVMMKVSGVLQANMSVINDFKSGLLDEAKFDLHMIDALKKATGIELSVAEFNECWHKQHPEFESYNDSLRVALNYAHTSGKQVDLISYTNPKDIRNLLAELQVHQIPYKLIAGELAEIEGVRLYLSYAKRKSKPELFADYVKSVKSGKVNSALANSMRDVTGSSAPQADSDVFYISVANDIQELTLKADQDKTISDIEKMSQQYGVVCITWNKAQQFLRDVFEALDKITLSAVVVNN